MIVLLLPEAAAARGALLAGVYAALPRRRGNRADETAASPCRVEILGRQGLAPHRRRESRTARGSGQSARPRRGESRRSRKGGRRGEPSRSRRGRTSQFRGAQRASGPTGKREMVCPVHLIFLRESTVVFKNKKPFR